MKKYSKQILVVVILLCAVLFGSQAFACKHENTVSNIVTPSTCTSDGVGQIICSDCGNLMETFTIPPDGHEWGEYEITVKPTANSDGTQTRSCGKCNAIESIVYKCSHEHSSEDVLTAPTCSEYGVMQLTCDGCGFAWENTIDKLPHLDTHCEIIRQATCSETGVEAEICNECGQQVSEHIIATIPHEFTEWAIEALPTHLVAGIRTHSCKHCGFSESSTYSISQAMQDNMLYIPSSNILCKFSVNYFTQAAVDHNDVVYTEYAYSVEDPTNPFILGHYYGSLSKLKNTKIGDYIYLCKNDNIEIYKVVVSEHAVERNGIYMEGIETGTNVFDCFGSAMNSERAVYGAKHGGVDRSPDSNDGKTLHMYTCDHVNTATEGRRGRWIVLATLVDTIPATN